MKKLFLILLFIFTFHNIYSQNPYNCVVPSVLRASYANDVSHLALQRIYLQNAIYKDSISIPALYEDTIWSALAAIYNSTSIIRDSIFDNYCIHQNVSDQLFHSIYIGLDSNCSWLPQWLNSNIISGVPALDSLLSKYGFSNVSFPFLGVGLNTAELYTPQNINIRPLCNSLEAFVGVSFAEPVISYGDGNEITYNYLGNGAEFHFIIGYGDCMAGCTAERNFRFYAGQPCTSSYQGVTYGGAPSAVFPPPYNCNLSTSNINTEERGADFKIYPNPSNEIINFSSEVISNGELKITDALARTNLTIKMNNGFAKVDGLNAGMYFVQLRVNGKTLSTEKFIVVK